MEKGQGGIVPRPICAVSLFLIRMGEGNGRDVFGKETTRAKFTRNHFHLYL